MEMKRDSAMHGYVAYGQNCQVELFRCLFHGRGHLLVELNGGDGCESIECDEDVEDGARERSNEGEAELGPAQSRNSIEFTR